MIELRTFNLTPSSKLFLLVAVVSLVLLIGAPPVSAHYVYADGYTYASSTDCTQQRAEVSHGGGGGYARVDTLAKYRSPIVSIDCADFFSRPPNHLAAAYDLYKWDGNAWYVCAWTDWNYNPFEAENLQLSNDLGDQPPCGVGYYGVMGWGSVLNGTWHPPSGGTMWSGYHYLPA